LFGKDVIRGAFSIKIAIFTIVKRGCVVFKVKSEAR
jgi:hypothetical protein